MKYIIALAIALSLSACATANRTAEVAASVIKADPEKREFTRNDARRALEIAQADGNAVAAGCYQSIIDHLPDEPAVDRSTVGALSKFQVARSLRRELEKPGISEETKVKCAPLVLDAQNTVGELLLKITGR